jgi:Family of unknown function (DUF6600)
MVHTRLCAVAFFVGATMFPLTLVAQTPPNAPPPGQTVGDQQQESPPARVGRLGYFAGQVWQFGAGTAQGDQWVPAELNYPVTSNTAFATGIDSRAEFGLGGGVARIGPGSELDVVTLDDANTDLRVPQGEVSLYLGAQDPNNPIDTVVTTPRGDVALSAPGRYEIAAGTQDEPSVVTVFDGQAQITDAAGASFSVAGGQAAVLSGDSAHPSFAIRSAHEDGLEAWARARDRQVYAAAPPAGVPRQITGVDSLGAYGRWETTSAYGAIWIPNDVPADWQPYRDGHWAYIEPWGWTWIDREPWGFAPFHYGRWVRFQDRWCWAPGLAYGEVREGPAWPVYAPALVVFAHIVTAAQRPAVAWYPLGWNEPYFPSYHVSRRYFERVNEHVVERREFVRVTNVYNRIYVRHENVRPYEMFHATAFRDRAVAVPRHDFAERQPVATRIFRPQPKALRPLVRPAGVAAPHVAPRPVLRRIEPPKPKILPAARRAPIPKALLREHRRASGPVRPTAVRPPTLPQHRPSVVTPARPMVTHPPTLPQHRPGTVTPGHPTVMHPPAVPQHRPGVVMPGHPTVMQPPAAPQHRPGAVTPGHPTDMHPPAVPQHRPNMVRPIQHPPTVHPSARPIPGRRPTSPGNAGRNRTRPNERRSVRPVARPRPTARPQIRRPPAAHITRRPPSRPAVRAPVARPAPRRVIAPHAPPHPPVNGREPKKRPDQH